MSYAILLPAIILPLLAIAAVGIFFYIKQKHKAADSVWHVKEKELEFDDPPQIIGRGTFGLVLLAEYRGTQVAVKRVIPPKQRRPTDSGRSSSSSANGTSSQSINKRYSFLPSVNRSRDSIITPGTTNRLASLEGIAEGEDESHADSSHAASSAGKRKKMRRHSSGLSFPSRRASDMSLLSDDEADDAKKNSTGSMEIPFGRRSSDSGGIGMARRRSSSGAGGDGKAKRRGSNFGRKGSDDLGDEKQRRRLSAYNAFDMADDPEAGRRSSASGAFHDSSGAFNQSSGDFSSNGMGSGILGNASGAFDSSAIFDHEAVGTSSGDGLSSMQIMPSNNGTNKSGRRSTESGGSYSGSFAKKGNWLLRSIGLASKDEYAKLKADFIVEMRHLSKCEYICRRIIILLICFMFFYIDRSLICLCLSLISLSSSPPSAPPVHHNGNGSCHRKGRRADAHHGVHGHGLAARYFAQRKFPARWRFAPSDSSRYCPGRPLLTRGQASGYPRGLEGAQCSRRRQIPCKGC